MQRILTTVALIACCVPAAHADFGKYLGHRTEGQSLLVQTDLGEIRLTAIDDAAFEIHYLPEGVPQLPSFALAGSPDDVTTALSTSENLLAFAIDGLTAIVHKDPLRIEYLRDGEPLVAEERGYFNNGENLGFRFELEEGEKILGGGQRVLGMDRRGQRMPLYNRASYGYETSADQMYYSVPAVLSSDKYMLVFDNSASGWLDIGSTDNDVLAFEAVGGRSAYLVIAGDSYPALIKNYTDVTGTQPLPPRWAFGSFASRFGYHSEVETRSVVRRYQQQKMPLDAVILDLFWYGPDIKGHVGNLDWDRTAFPAPENMIAEFRDQGVKTIAVTQPFVLSTSKRWQEAVDNDVLAKNADGDPYRFDFYFGNTGLIDIFDERARDWFWQAYERLFSQGIAGTWGDLGEPEVHPDDILHWLSDAGMTARGDEVHNAFGHTWAKMIYERQAELQPEVRPLLLMRSGFAGTQRYGMVPWTGDVNRSWGGLKPQIELSLQMSLLGLAYTHSDLGGFAGGTEFDKELYIRWLQYGVFQPVYRPHGQEHIASEPVFHDRQTRNIARDYIELRYRLLPYIYTLAFENSMSGMPLMRPLFFENEDDLSLIDEKNSYLWGDAFLVAPVMDPGLDKVDVRLPSGVWFDFWDNTRHTGGGSVTVPVTLETIPVLVRAGAFVPMVDAVQTTHDYSSRKLVLHYYADRSVRQSSGQMFEDDGTSRSSLETGRFELLKFTSQQDGNSLTIGLQREGGGYEGMPESRDLSIVIHNWTFDVDEVRLGGQVLEISRRAMRRGSGAYHDRKKSKLFVNVLWNHDAAELRVNPQQAIVGKPVVYQLLPRLFGNRESQNTPWGTIEQNGVGKFSDITDKALQGIRELGTTHVWYTGVLHHAVIRDYSDFGITDDDPDVVKGRAGSPYAIKDYYNVNPDLAIDPGRRLQEFRELIDRTHANDMKVIIDIVPNHVARAYQSVAAPAGVRDFGADDDTSVEWARDNNFYYVVGESFRVPAGYTPLNGEAHPLADGQFAESPAKWTGNGSRSAEPKIDDWFETVKVNFGVQPDGSHAFDSLPDEALRWSNEELVKFWSQRDVPDSWKKFRDIVHFWMDQGVDGFRYDMAQEVPVEFWSYLNSSIKVRNPNAFLLAEIYEPEKYRDYVRLGRMDYLYDKVGFYDSLREVMQGQAGTATLIAAQDDVADIEQHMLHFLENHDEQRIASSEFAGDARAGKPAMTVSTLINRAPTLLYFGQEVGEPGDGDAGFGKSSRTTIFDYWGVPAHQRWMNGGKYDGGKLTDEQRSLRDFYSRLLSFSAVSPAMQGAYAEIHSHNLRPGSEYGDRMFSFVRWADDDKLIVISNFDDAPSPALSLELPPSIVAAWQLADGRYALDEQLYGTERGELVVDGGLGRFRVTVDALGSLVLRVGEGLFRALDREPYVADWRNSGVKGTLVYWSDVESEFLDESRRVEIWLPPGYEEDPARRYRVIYMHDGENLFDPRIANTGIDWGIDEAMLRGVEDGRFDPAIVVAAWSTDERRYEYSPWEGASQYARFLIEELMPRVNAEFRTQTGPANTFVMGSSMGGLLSWYLVMNRPDVFSACGCVSTHFALSDASFDAGAGIDTTPYVLKDIAAGAAVPDGVRFYFDYGTETLDATYEEDHAPVRDWLLDQGLDENVDFRMSKYDGAAHSEKAWRERVGEQLEWLLNPGAGDPDR